MNRDPRYRDVNGVCSAGLSMTTLPQARAGASFKLLKKRGKFHGTMAPTMPTGSCLVYTKKGPSAKQRTVKSKITSHMAGRNIKHG